jgi:hypothetical protein
VSPRDPVVAALAARQEAVVSRAQLLAAGMGAGAIDFRIHRGRLHPQHRGVYAVGHTGLTARGAEISFLLDAAVLRRRLAELPGRRTLALEAALDSLSPGPQATRRQLEEGMLALLARHDLPRPLVNATVEGYEVDFYWPQARLIVETDGAATHLTATAFEQDRERDAALTVAGYRVVRFTWRQLTDRAGTVADTLRALLGYSTSP